MKNSFDVRIASWGAWAPGLETREHWLAWVDENRDLTDGPRTVDLTAFPAMLRRRLSSAGKTALHSIFQLQKDSLILEDNIPAVFCSQYGEVARSGKLLKSLSKGESLSPTDFSLSVHNAVAGVYSIGCKQTNNISSMSAGEGGLTMALLEASAMSTGSAQEKALCVIYDAPLPEPYPSGMNQCEYAFALSMLLVGIENDETHDGDSIRISLLREVSDVGAKESVPSAFIRFLLDKKQSVLELRHGASQWRYERLGE